MSFQADRKFDTLEKAFAFILDEFARSEPDRIWEMADSGLLVPVKAPKYLFRGECGDFPTTISSARRPETYGVVVHGEKRVILADELVRLTDALVRRFGEESDFKLNVQAAVSLLKHYGFPTTLVDFTGNLSIAFAFAGNAPSPVARIAVMPRAGLAAVQLIDLTAHDWAERARRQAAFGFLPLADFDLKSDGARAKFGIKWYEFSVCASDAEYLGIQYRELLGEPGDPSAGFLRFLITEYVEARGALSSELTEWLLTRIPMAPRCFLVKAFETSEAVVNFRGSEVLPSFDERIERQRSREYWLGERSSFERMRSWTWPPVGSVVADPRTYHPDTYPSAGS